MALMHRKHPVLQATAGLRPTAVTASAPSLVPVHKAALAGLVTVTLAAAALLVPTPTLAGPVYRCPGATVSYTDQITPQEARERGCKSLEGTPVTVVQPNKPRPVPAAVSPAASRPADQRVETREQRERDADARRILEAELRKEEEKLAALKKDYNNGEPERVGGEKNYQRYLDRVEEMKQGIARKEADIAAIKRELSKFAAAPSNAEASARPQ